jgi:hypothetical protein
MDVSDITVPAQEIMVANQQRAPFDDAAAHEESVDENRAEQVKASAPALQVYEADKFYWRQSASGNYYLSPLPAFLEYVVSRAPKVVEFGLKELGDDSTDRKLLADSLLDTLSTIRGTMHENDATDYIRWCVGRATRNAVYAAITQFECEAWAQREAAAGRDARERDNFADKEARIERSAVMAATMFGALMLIDDQAVRQLLPKPADFAKTAKSIIYQNADIETRRKKTPGQLDAETSAKVDAATVGIARF